MFGGSVKSSLFEDAVVSAVEFEDRVNWVKGVEVVEDVMASL